MKLKKKCLNTIRSNAIIFIFLFLSLIPLLWYPEAFKYEVYGRGDYISPFNTDDYLKMNIYTYDIYYQGGNYAPSQLAHIFYISFFRVLNSAGITSAGATLIFISVNLFLSQISVYTLLKFLLNKENEGYPKYLLFVGSTFYSFSLFFLSLLSPGHHLLLVNYALFPLLFKYLLEYLGFGLASRERSYFGLDNIKVLIKLFLTSLLMTSSFANPGVLYSALLIMTAATCLYIIIFRKRLVEGFIKFSIYSLIIIISQLWWLIPMSGGLVHTLEKVNTSRGSAIYNLQVASTGRSMSKTLFGLGSGSTSAFNYTNPNSPRAVATVTAASYAFLLMVVLLSIPLFKKKRKVLYFLSLLIFAVFITKGLNDPFQRIFLFLYQSVPGFKVYRRPSSKIYFFLILQMSVLIVHAFYQLSKGRKKLYDILKLFLIPIVLSLLIIFYFAKPVTSMFNIPQYYDEIKKDLINDNFEQLFIFPNITGVGGNTYNENFSLYYGVDFIHMELGISYLNLVNIQAGNKPNTAYTKDIYEAVENREDICNFTRKYGITHLGLRYELSNTYNLELIELEKKLKENPDIASYENYGPKFNGFIIYKLKPECLGKLIYSDSYDIEYKSINPITYLIKTNNGDGIENNIVLSRKQHPSWILKKIDKYTYDRFNHKNFTVFPHTTSIITKIDKDMILNLKNMDFEKKVNKSPDLNEWGIQGGAGKSSEDGYYIMYNLGQTYFYIGILITLTFSAVLGSVYLIIYIREKKAK